MFDTASADVLAKLLYWTSDVYADLYDQLLSDLEKHKKNPYKLIQLKAIWRKDCEYGLKCTQMKLSAASMANKYTCQ